MAEIVKSKDYLFKMSDDIPASKSITYDNAGDKTMMYIDTLGSFIHKDMPDKVATLLHVSYRNIYLKASGVYSDTQLSVPRVALVLKSAKTDIPVEELLSVNVTPNDYFHGVFTTYSNIFYTMFDFLDVTYKGYAGISNNDIKMLKVVRTANDILCKHFYREIHVKSPIAEALQYQIASTIFYEFHEYFKVVDEIRSKYGVKMVYESQYLKDYYVIIDAPKLVREYIMVYCIPKYVDYNEKYRSVFPKVTLLYNVPKYGHSRAFFIGMEYFLEFIKNNLHYNGNISLTMLQKFADNYAVNGYYHSSFHTSKIPYKDILNGNISSKHFLQAPIEQSKAKYPYHPFIITD